MHRSINTKHRILIMNVTHMIHMRRAIIGIPDGESSVLMLVVQLPYDSIKELKLVGFYSQNE